MNKSVADNSFITETAAGPVLNQFTSPTYMTHLPIRQREMLIAYLRKKLAKWASIREEDLEMTSLYGIRKYTRHAILGMHVDTCETHVISAILNVASSLDENEDWGLQIYDHFGTLHEIFMKPGEAVFYESAKCGHARFKPMKGEYYANVFIHFRPKSKWEFNWF